MSFPQFLKALVIGPGYSLSRDTKNTLCCMIQDRGEIWHDDTFGLLRIVRLILSHIQFANVFNLICSMLDLIHPILSRLFTDLYVIFKLIAPIVMMRLWPEATCWTAFFAWYVIIETIIYLYTQILVTTSMSGPQSNIRTFLMILVDYMTVNLCFAYLYYGYHLVSGVNNPLEAFYFSIVAGSTTGFGDKLPTSATGYRIVSIQILSTFSFLVAFFAYFIPSRRNVGNNRQ